jgi:uncharacterized membrane protein YuzA (DUF378 family)
VVVGVMLSGVMVGLFAALVSLVFGHPPLAVALAYSLAGLFGSCVLMFIALIRPARAPFGP